jgi:hypothetical protein
MRRTLRTAAEPSARATELLRALILACSFLLACTDVIIVPNDGDGGGGDDDVGASSVGAGTPGVGGAGGSGGSPVTGPRFIEVELVAPPEAKPERAVLVNRIDGSLRSVFAGDQLPPMIEVEDGDLVSFFERYEGLPRLDSYRVTPEVWRIQSDGYGPGCEELEPMEVTFSITPVPGASDYTVQG